MSILPPRADWDGKVRAASDAEVARAESTAARIRREVTEIRAAAERLSDGIPFETAVAEFLTVQAALLERGGGTAQRAEMLRTDEDTREAPGMFPSAARSALLIARAIPDRASHEGHDQGGGWTTHRGRLEDCPAPECQDRVIEQQEGGQ